MTDYQAVLAELLQLTEEIVEQAEAVHLNMQHNQPEQLEALQRRVAQRDQVIKRLDAHMKLSDFHWTTADRQTIHKLKQYEQMLQPRMNALQQSFLTQMNRIQQTKKVAKKYRGVYHRVTPDGAFIDQRK